jgi:hypothetical protein
MFFLKQKMYQLKNKFYIEEIYYLTNFKWLKKFTIFYLFIKKTCY